MKASFEERLTALVGEAGLKAAKQLLKNHLLIGAWRAADGSMHGRFRRPGGAAIDVEVTPGDEQAFRCGCRAAKCCEHAAALIMYSGRFNPRSVAGHIKEEPPSYYGGLRQESLPKLLDRARPPVAELFISTESTFPHVPSKWENVVLAVKLKTRQREYLGNLNNLRQLYFDKSLSVVLRLEHFSLHEQQIIRFLAINGEAENSQIQLNAELTAEFFHCLVGYKNFFRDGRQLTIRRDVAETVLISSNHKLSPGIRVGGAVLPVAGAKVIAGRAGCWVGRDGEYFFVPANCEIGFLRNFFRSGLQSFPPGINRDELTARLPFPVITAANFDVEARPASVLLDGNLTGTDELSLDFSYVYPSEHGGKLFSPRSGNLAREGERFWKRDIEFERRFEQALEMFGFVIDEGRARLVGTDAIGLFLDRYLAGMLRDHPDWSVSGRFAALLDGTRGLPVPDFNCELAVRCVDAFSVGYRLELRGIGIDWKNCVDSAMKRDEFLAVPGAGLARLSPELSEFFRRSPGVVRNIDTVENRFDVPFCCAAYFTELVRDIPGAVVPEIATGAPVAVQSDAPPRFKFTGELRSYQSDGVAYLQWMTDRNLNPLLADEMGLGKTIQLLALLASRLRKNDAPVLIVCPASLVTNWEREANRFVPGMKVAAPQGGAERDELWKHTDRADLIVLSYAAARLSSPVLKRLRFSYLVLDEAQHIKNPGSTNAKSCKNITAAHRLVLSGTPLENSPEDLWSIMDFLQPGMLGTLPAFRRSYAGAGSDPELQRDLGRRVGPFIKRRTKAEVASDLPPRSERTLYCRMGEEQAALYEKTRTEGIVQLAGYSPDDRKNAATIFTTLLRLRQICCHPALLPDGAGNSVPSAKQELLMELLHENIDSAHKMLLFSQFTSMLHLFIPQLESDGIAFEYLDGTTRNRQQHVDHFNQSPEIPLFLLSLKAGGTGLNLTSADTVIIHDPWWNPAVESQAAGRSHRIGQTRAVSTYRLVVKDSIEEKVLALQEQKRQLFDTVIDNPTASGGFSLDELRFLLD